jgi:hypothetical protein
MNIYVHDNGWQGGDIVVLNSMEEAIVYFRNLYLPEYIKRSENHNKANTINPWIREVKKYSGDFSDEIQEYSIEHGTAITLEGDS